MTLDNLIILALFILQLLKIQQNIQVGIYLNLSDIQKNIYFTLRDWDFIKRSVMHNILRTQIYHVMISFKVTPQINTYYKVRISTYYMIT